jgi:signal transduction histidine kinase
VYGARKEPLRAVADLGDRVAVTDEEVLVPAALASVSASMRVPGAQIVSADGQLLGRVGADVGFYQSIPMWFGGEVIATLGLSGDRTTARRSQADQRLYAALASQLAVLVHAIQLSRTLQAERDRVVAATLAERDRLRRDLHDGLGPSLSGISLGVQAAQTALVAGDRTTCSALVERMRAETHSAITEIRRLIDDLRPTVLDALGLVEAIRASTHLLSSSVTADVTAVDLSPIPIRVETAAYRIATEALTNAARHAHAQHIRIVLSVDGAALKISVSDDGRGVGDAQPGVGLTSMRRRADDLAGQLQVSSNRNGTTVTAILPLEGR